MRILQLTRFLDLVPRIPTCVSSTKEFISCCYIARQQTDVILRYVVDSHIAVDPSTSRPFGCGRVTTTTARNMHRLSKGVKFGTNAYNPQIIQVAQSM